MFTIIIATAASFTLSSHGVSTTTLAAASEQDQITIVESGVARQVEARKRIRCGDVEWRISWKSDADGNLADVEIEHFASGKGVSLEHAANELAVRLKDLHGVSATCNPARESNRVVSRLLILAVERKSGVPMLAQLTIDYDTSDHEWFFSER